MSFLKDFLDSVLGEPVGNSTGSTIWDKLPSNSETLNLNGVSNLSNQPLLNRQDGGRRLPSEQLASIIQNRDRAFNRIDINPMLLNSSQYRAQVDPSRLYDLMGYESDNYAGNQGALSNSEKPLAGWRTVEIAFAGNFLKFEFLPGLVNTNVASSYDGNIQSNFNKPAYSQLANVGTDLTGAVSNRQVLIQFDDTSGPLILAKDGDTFKVPFERVYVTFKFFVPRFSLIVGYNAEIISSGQTKSLNQKPAYGGGYSLWNNEDRHCIPFNFQTQGWNSADYTWAPQNCAKNNTDHIPIYDLEANNSIGTNAPYGQAVGWITGVDVSVYSNGTTDLIYGNFQLGIAPSSTVVGANTYTRCLYMLPVFKYGNSAANFNIRFNEPIRFSLNRRQGATSSAVRLLAKFQNSNSSNASVSYYFTVTGYIWGKDAQENNPSPLEALTTAPFPLDAFG